MTPDLIVLVSAHWVCTFNWYVAAHETHSGICVADEAPDLMPGTPYRRTGDPSFANALAANIADAGLPCRTNATPNFKWDYASLVPLLYLDPDARIPVVLLPTCLAADLDECREVGRTISKTAMATDSKVIVVASCAGLECDPDLLEQVENLRTAAMYPDCIDVKTTQMILFAVLLSHVSPASEFHARGAMRAGATKKEMHAVAALAFCSVVCRRSILVPKSSTKSMTSRKQTNRGPCSRRWRA